jgi:release factor glutamine methyltransferase
MTESWTIGRVVTWAADDFRRRGIESPRFEAELLLAFALKTDRMHVIIEPARPLDDRELARYRDFIRRRRAGEPVAYIRGEKEFYGRLFHIDRRVLVPRPDTEILVETALRRTTSSSMGGRYLDLCTGSGCVAVTFARERPTCKVFAVDLSADALAVAEDNAIRLGGVFQMAFLQGDLYEPLRVYPGLRFDLITANPPYISDSSPSSRYRAGPTASPSCGGSSPVLARGCDRAGCSPSRWEQVKLKGCKRSLRKRGSPKSPWTRTTAVMNGS